MNLPNVSVFNLSLEQQFLVRSFQEEVAAMDELQAKALLVELSRQLMIKDNIVRSMVKQALFD